ncbi:MAG: DUF2442 domain-containing protein [Rhodothermales bacterium]
MSKNKKNNTFLHVNSFRYLQNYVLRICFNDGVEKDVDLRNQLIGEVFEPLMDLAVFQTVYLDDDTRTISWPSGADFAPEYLYELGEKVRKAA